MKKLCVSAVVAGVLAMSVSYAYAGAIKVTRDIENESFSCESSAGIPLEYAYATRNLNFERGINVPDNAIEQWDISEAQNGSVIAYALPNEESSSFL